MTTKLSDHANDNCTLRSITPIPTPTTTLARPIKQRAGTGAWPWCWRPMSAVQRPMPSSTKLASA